jgi:hypothetical protein
MDKKKRVTILVVIALLLASTAIYLNVARADVPTERSESDEGGSGNIGIGIETPEIEDKLEEGAVNLEE